MKRILLLPFIFLIFLSVACKEEKKNELEIFVERLNTAESFTVEFSAKRDFFPKYDFEGRIVYDSDLIYAYLNTSFGDYGNEVYLDNGSDSIVDIYYEQSGHFLKKSVSKESISVSFDIKLDVTDFTLNEDGSYVLSNEATENILGLEFKDTVVTLTDDGAQLKAYYLYAGEVEIPIYINILDIDSSEVLLPTI